MRRRCGETSKEAPAYKEEMFRAGCARRISPQRHLMRRFESRTDSRLGWALEPGQRCRRAAEIHNELDDGMVFIKPDGGLRIHGYF